MKSVIPLGWYKHGNPRKRVSKSVACANKYGECEGRLLQVRPHERLQHVVNCLQEQSPSVHLYRSRTLQIIEDCAA